MEIKIELRAAPLPAPLTKIAVHLYLNVFIDNQIERWELWEKKNAFTLLNKKSNTSAQKSNGHIHCNLKLPLDGVGGGQTFSIDTWQGEEAHRLYQTILNTFERYPNKDFYLAWPGPNSNTYVRYLLEEAKLLTTLPGTAIGKDWHGLAKFKKENAIKWNLLTMGLHFNRNFCEIHGLGLTLGYHWKRKCITHPFSKGLCPTNMMGK